MVPLVVLIIALLIFRGLGALGVSLFLTWQACALWALAVMLLLTASAHFTSTKEDLIKMVPPLFPFPRQLVFVTGLLEIVGAIGLLIPLVRPAAGICLALLLIALLPANIHAALNQLSLRGRATTPLWLRVPLQLLFIGLALWAALG
jgi:uncharacterized membrane protein